MQTQGLIIHNIMQRISSIIVLLHIFKQSATEDTSLSLQKFENNAWIRAWKLKADLELDMRTHYLLQILGFHVSFTCYCMLTVCS